MNPVRRKRFLIILGVLAGVGIAVAIALMALRENINLFYTPSQIAAGQVPKDRSIRIGGLVVKDSVQRHGDALDLSFVVTDMKASTTVHYNGILPDLFREGQGIIARGRLQADGSVQAEEVLAKHDEKYMPPEVKDALKGSGHPGA